MTSKWISRLTILVALGTSACKDDGSSNDAGMDTDTDTLGSATMGTFGTSTGTLTSTPTSASMEGGSPGTDPSEPTETSPNPTMSASETSEPEPDSGDEDPSAGDETDDAGEDTDTTVPPGEGLEEMIAVLCEWEFNCCSAGEVDFRLGPFTSNVADCTERHIEQLYSNDDVLPPASLSTGLLSTLAYGVRLDRSQPNEDAISACLEMLRSNACTPVPMGLDPVACEPGQGGGENPCDLTQMFTGIQEVGEPCTERFAGYDFECAEGSSCEEYDGEFVCVDKGLEGDFCERADACDQEFYCDFETGRCASRADLGEPCSFEDPDDPQLGSESIPCRGGYTCTPDIDSPTAGTCAAYCSQGFDCFDDSQCPENLSCVPVRIGGADFNYCLPPGSDANDRCDSNGDCVDGMYCDEDNRCADVIDGGAQGCTTSESCEPGYFCQTLFDDETRACNAQYALGQQCESDDGLDACVPDAIGCINGECRADFEVNGEPCDPAAITRAPGNQFCFSSICEDIGGEDGPECVPGLDVGDDCSPTDTTADAELCGAGLYCDDDGECQRRLQSGEECDPEVPQHCLNGTCVEAWNGDFLCSDAPSSVTEAVCDGQG